MNALILKKPYELEYCHVSLPLLRQGWATLRLIAVSVCGSDFHAYRGGNPMQTYPRILGHEVCAVVEEICGPSDSVKVGDTVVLMPYLSCGECKACKKGKSNACSSLSVYGVHREGAMADFLQAPLSQLIVVDSSLDPVDVALVEPLAISAHAVSRAGVSCGDTVLVSGAGFIGLGAALQAQLKGCRVILSDTHEKRRAFADEHTTGFVAILDPLDDHYAQRIAELTEQEGPDCIIDATGNAVSMASNVSLLSNGGRMVYVGISKDPIALPGRAFHIRETELFDSRAATLLDFQQVIDLVQTKVLIPSSLVTHRARFDERVAETFKEWAELGGEVFKAVILMAE